MQEIELRSRKYKGLLLVVDDVDYPLMSQYKWHPSHNRTGGKTYAQTYIDGKPFYAHHLIMGHYQTDHKDGDGLHCWRDNMRLCNCSQNEANKRKSRRKATSIYKGVSFDKRRHLHPWYAFIKKYKKTFYLGSFSAELEAAQAYDKAALEFFGEFALLNLPRSKGEFNGTLQ